MLKLIRPDTGDDIGSHAPRPAVNIPRIRHNTPPGHGTSIIRETTGRPTAARSITSRPITANIIPPAAAGGRESRVAQSPDMDEDNDGRFADDSAVEVRYPRNKQEEQGDRSAWPWLPGSILGQCGPAEWHVCVEARELATLDDGSPAPDGTADEDLFQPCCFRDASELRRATDGEDRWSPRRWRASYIAVMRCPPGSRQRRVRS